MVLLTSSLIVAAVVGVIAGVLIGCIGVGGVILVPSLIQLPDVNVSLAVPACLFSYIFGGVVGVITYSCKRKIDWRQACLFCVAAAPSALLGAYLFHLINGFAIKITAYALTFITSMFTLVRVWKERRAAAEEVQQESVEDERVATSIIQAADNVSVCRTDEQPIDRRHSLNENSDNPTTSEESALILETEDMKKRCNKHSVWLRALIQTGMGSLVGLGSALTGTSGPVILLPMLICLRWDIKVALGICQVIQVPIAVASTLGNVFFGKNNVDFVLGSCIAAGLAPAVIIGALVANKIPARPLKITVSVMLIVASLGLLLWESAKA